MGIEMGATFTSQRSHLCIVVIGISILFSLSVGQPNLSTSVPTTAGSTQAHKQSGVPTNVLTYDCRRAGAYCLNNLCNDSTGRCDCDERLNFYCKNISTQLKPADCGECLHGVCIDSNGTKECVCDEGFYGPGCNVPRVDVECNENNMTVYIYPYGLFEGEIFVIGDNITDKDSCTFKSLVNESGHGSHTKGLYLVLEHISGDCGNATITEEYGNLNSTREFFLEYAKQVREETDQIITVSCDYTPHIGKTLNASITVQDVQSEIKTIDVYKDTSVKVAFTVTGKGSSKANSVVLGQEIDLKFVMETTEHSAFNDFIITECEVNNGGTNKENISITLIRDECPTREVLPLIIKNFNTTVASTQRTEIMSMRAFVFLDESNSTLTFECTVEFCDKTCPHPVQPCQSSTTTAPFLRRRRSAENEQRVSAKITVVDPASQIKATSDLMIQDCLQQPSLIAIISTLAGLVLLLLILCIILILRLLKSTKKQVTSASASMREPMYELRIPRMSITPANRSYHYN